MLSVYFNKYNLQRPVNALFCHDESLTVQSEADEADINKIVARFIKTGVMPVNPRTPLNEAFLAPLEFREALDGIRKAEEAFMEYPAELRKKFDNDPAKFLEFTSNKDNLEEMYKLGLAKKPEADAPILVRIDTPPAA